MFLVSLGLGCVSRPGGVEAQEARIRRVGWLAQVPQPQLLAEFRRGLRELGYLEGSTFTLHEAYGGVTGDRLPGLAQELVNAKVDVILAEAAPSVQAAQRATKAIPIVFITGDPVESGFVQSLARPGGNSTGIANLAWELFPKRVEVLRDALPRLRRLVVVRTVGSAAGQALTTKIIKDTTRAAGIEISVTVVVRTEDLDAAYADAARAGVEAILVSPNPFFNIHRDRVIALAARYQLPALYEFRDFVEAGGLMCYGADMKNVYRRLAGYVDKIFKGAKAGDLPVEQPTKFELVINLKTAKALNLAIPTALLLRADSVIE